MQKERPVETVRRWVFEDWKQSQPSVNELTTKLHSISNETNRVPDSHYYRYQGGVLLDPDTGSPILQHISPGVEYEVAKDLQTRVSEADEGMFIWNSPKLDGVYPCNKTMIYQITYTPRHEKALLYTAILYDGDIENPEWHRGTLFSVPDTEESMDEALAWIDKVSKKTNQLKGKKSFSRRDAAYFAQQLVDGVNPNEILNDMQSYGFIGQNAISCPGGVQTFSNYSTGRGDILIYSGIKDKYGSLEFKCSIGHWNRRPFGKLIKYCKTCGVDVSCGNRRAIAA